MEVVQAGPGLIVVHAQLVMRPTGPDMHVAEAEGGVGEVGGAHWWAAQGTASSALGESAVGESAAGESAGEQAAAQGQLLVQVRCPVNFCVKFLVQLFCFIIVWYRGC